MGLAGGSFLMHRSRVQHSPASTPFCTLIQEPELVLVSLVELF